jgi:hypothetical protein
MGIFLSFDGKGVELMDRILDGRMRSVSNRAGHRAESWSLGCRIGWFTRSIGIHGLTMASISGIEASLLNDNNKNLCDVAEVQKPSHLSPLSLTQSCSKFHALELLILVKILDLKGS